MRKRGQHRALVALRDRGAQRVVERENLHVVGDAARDVVELPRHGRGAGGQLTFALGDQRATRDRIDEQRREDLHRDQRGDEEKREAQSEAHGIQ